jgi:[CysO sulfur-carrier protein]-S-L-cysteine hydrolase
MKYLYTIDDSTHTKNDSSIAYFDTAQHQSLAPEVIAAELDKYITIDGIKEIYRQAIEQYPHECCGLILQQGIRPCTNIQNQLHQSDPRTAATAFTFSAPDALFLSRNIHSENPVKIIYHSHPDVGAYFSHTDKTNALYEGQPIYPVDHLVIDVQNSSAICAKIFRFIATEYTLIAILPGSNDKKLWGSLIP